MFARQALASLLIALLACPAWTSTHIVGIATQSQDTVVRGQPLLPGSSIFDGETLHVGPRGSARIVVAGGAQVRVAPESRVRLVKAGDLLQLEVASGRVAFRTSAKSPLEARLADARIRSARGEPAVGIVAVLNPKAAMIVADKGELLVTTAHDSKSVTLREGEAVEVALALAPQAAGAAGGGAAISGTWVAILGVIIVGVVTALALGHSDAEQSDARKRNAVSPFSFP